MSEYIKGRNVRVEIGLTEGAPKTIGAISLSNPGVVSIPGHGLSFGSCGYFDDIVGMDQIDGQGVRIADGGSPSADNFVIEDVDTSDFAVLESGVFVPITAWSTLSQSTQINLGGGTPKTEDVGTLLDKTDKIETIKNSAETVTIDVRALTEDNQAMAKIRQIARALGYLVFRVTYSDGAQRVWRGQPSIPGESVAQGALGNGQMTVTVKGQICYLAAL